jgi:hypothetical protein
MREPRRLVHQQLLRRELSDVNNSLKHPFRIRLAPPPSCMMRDTIGRRVRAIHSIRARRARDGQKLKTFGLVVKRLVA